MPVIVVTTTPLTETKRADLAKALTVKVGQVAEAPLDKVQVFFIEETPGPVSVALYAIAHGPGESGWIDAIQQAVGFTYHIKVHLFEPNYTAKGGTLRQPHPSSDTQAPTEPERP